MKKNLELVMALTLTERVLAVKIMIIKLVLISTVVLIMMRIMIKVRTLELLLSWVINHYHLQVEPNPKKKYNKTDAIFSIYGKNGINP